MPEDRLPNEIYAQLQRENEPALDRIRAVVAHVVDPQDLYATSTPSYAIGLVVRAVGRGKGNRYFAVSTTSRCAGNPKVAHGAFNLHVKINGSAGAGPEGWTQNPSRGEGATNEWWNYTPRTLHTPAPDASELEAVKAVVERARASYQN